MKTKFYIYLSFFLLFLTSCNFENQKKVKIKKSSSLNYDKIIDYMNTKPITSYYNENEVVIGSSFDNSNTLGIFEILYFDREINLLKLYEQKSTFQSKILSKYKKTAFFFEKKYIEKVPSKHIEGLAVGWEYDIKPPCTVFIFKQKKDHWFFSESTILNSYDDYEKIINSNVHTLINDSSNLEYTSLFGKYHLTQNKGKIDEFSSMVIGYNIEIKKDSVFFSGQGYQTNFYDLCRVKKDKDTLKLYYNLTIDGTDYNKNSEQPLVKLYKKGSDYYVISPSIWVDAKPNVEVKFEKTD